MKLQFGCGLDKKVGYLNCDISKEVNPDMIVDLEKPLPFEDGCAEEIIMNHVLEHINNLIPLMKELHRILAPRGRVEIKVPFYTGWGAFNDPTHVRFFTPFSFDYFKPGEYAHEVDNICFDVTKRKINFGVGKSGKLNSLINPFLNMNQKIYCRFFAWVFPAAEIEFVLTKK